MNQKRIKFLFCLFLVFNISIGAYAADQEVKVGVTGSSFFGQYSPGKDNAGDTIPAYMDSWSEFVISTTGKKGPISANIKIKSRTENGQRSETSDMFRVASKSFQYKGMQGKLGIEVGTVTTAAPLNYMNGLVSGILPAQDGGNALFLNSTDGLKIEYFFAREKGRVIRFRFASYTCDSVRHPTCGGPGAYYLSGTNATSKTISDGSSQTPGSANAVSLFTIFGSLRVKVAQTTGTSDDHTANATKLNDSKTYLGVQYFITPKMSIYAGMNTATIEKANNKKALYSDLPITFSMSDLGPGKITISYNNLASSLDGNGYTSAVKDKYDIQTSYQNIVYDIPLVDSVGVQVVYNTSTKTPKTGDSISKSFIGGGLYGQF